VQHRETQARFDNGPRFEGHPTSACDVTVERFPNALAADYVVAVNHQNGARLIERSERFNIAEIKSLLEECVDFGRTICGHRSVLDGNATDWPY